MDKHLKSPKKLWKPPSFDDFNFDYPVKKIKLDPSLTDKCQQDEIVEIGKLPPNDLSQLATHPKKVEEVRDWLLHTSKQGRMLLLVGPTGSAKTTTLKLVAKSLNILIKEWVNPVDKKTFQKEEDNDIYDRYNYFENGQGDKFDEFIFRTSRFGSLFGESKSIILVEDFPNAFIWKPSLFHRFLEKYALHGKSPIVFICTDDSSLNLHLDLFPSYVKTTYDIATIKFNPVTTSSIVKVLNKEMEGYSDRFCLSKQTLENVSFNSKGDIRSAISGLQILLIGMRPSKMKPTTKRKKKTEADAPTFEAVAAKDTFTDFFQNTGRVLYPKMLRNTKDVPVFENKKRVFVHDVHDIAGYFSESFLKLLHENYLKTFSRSDDVIQGAERLSECDRFSCHEEVKVYGALTSVIGLMVANTEPNRKGFKPLKKSDWKEESRGEVLEKRTRFAEFRLTHRELHLDLIPYVKSMPGFNARLDSLVAERFSAGFVFRSAATVNPVVADFSDCDDDMTIEEDDD